MRVRFLLCIGMMLAIFASIARAAESSVSDADGIITWTPTVPASSVQGKFKPTRWGMYDVEARLENAAAGTIKLTIADKSLRVKSDNSMPVVIIGRTYLNTADERPIAITTEPADSKQPIVIKSLVFIPAPEGKPIVQSDDLSIILHAHDATVHGVNLRYEFRPDKNTLGYWSNPKDWVSWEFEVKKPGKFNVVVMQGSPGSKEIQIAVGEQTINYTTKNTGSFHTFTFLEVGTLTFDKPGMNTLTLKPAATVKGSIMDLRQIFLLPIVK